jgi:hypothetical protein
MNAEAQLELMKQVVAKLNGMDVKAYFEYPGYIGVTKDEGEVAFGTADGDWGWNDPMGGGGKLGLSGKESNADLIAKRIAAVVRQGAFPFGNEPKMAAQQLWLGRIDFAGDDYAVVCGSQEECRAAFWRLYTDMKSKGFFEHRNFEDIATPEGMDEYFGPWYNPFTLGEIIRP